jgi:hypothetical protein
MVAKSPKVSNWDTAARTANLTRETRKSTLSGLAGGRSSMVESKLVELVVAGSNPVDHPTFSSLCCFLKHPRALDRPLPFEINVVVKAFEFDRFR